MSKIAANIKSLKQQIPASVKLIAVSKTMGVPEIMDAYNAGQRSFGENRVQELIQKKDLLPSDIEWHLIGHLQTNKVSYVVPVVKMIQSVDTFKLLKIINYEASKVNQVIDCLLQIHIAAEETKYGFDMNEITEMVQTAEFWRLNSIKVCGVMGMATFTEDNSRIQKEFRYLSGCFKKLRDTFFQEDQYFREISMGMSGDFRIAISEGSTMIRIGSLIFGERNFKN
jgi:pyridoxal phosphate enzyme (YggS family)